MAVAGVQQASPAPLVMVWDLKSAGIICEWQDFHAVGRAVAFSPDSGYLLAGSQNPESKLGELILYNLHTCQVEHVFDPQGDVASIAFNPDGTRAITGAGYYGRVILWDIATATEIRRFTYDYPGPTLGLVFGLGGSTVLSTALTDLYLWDTQTGKVRRTFAGQAPFPWTVDLSPDNKYVASGMMDGSVILWDFLTAKELNRISLPDTVYQVAFSPDSGTLYAASQDGTLIKWRLAEKTLPQLLDWIKANRYVRELTCEERQEYDVIPLCAP